VLAIEFAEENNEAVARVYLKGASGSPVLLATARGRSGYVRSAAELFAREWQEARSQHLLGPSKEPARSEPRMHVALLRSDSETRPNVAPASVFRRPPR
jgi:hypothetical protein